MGLSERDTGFFGLVPAFGAWCIGTTPSSSLYPWPEGVRSFGTSVLLLVTEFLSIAHSAEMAMVSVEVSHTSLTEVLGSRRKEERNSSCAWERKFGSLSVDLRLFPFCAGKRPGMAAVVSGMLVLPFLLAPALRENLDCSYSDLGCLSSACFYLCLWWFRWCYYFSPF